MDSEEIKTETAFFSSPLGFIELSATNGTVTKLVFCDGNPAEQIPEALIDAVNQLRSYFSGNLTSFSLPIRPEGTPFQQSVWKILCSIPYGKTMSYGEIAVSLKLKNGARAVGIANRTNPISLLIPCHRVIGKKGELTGYAGGLWRKEWLLKMERSTIKEGLFNN